MSRRTRIRITADQECKICEGRGIRLRTEANQTFCEVSIKAYFCQCVKAELTGRSKLPTLTIPGEVREVVFRKSPSGIIQAKE